MLKNWRNGFSLAELLIALAIMGVIAAVTIPPMFQVPAGKTGTKYNAMAKDTACMIISAYEQYKAANGTVASTVSMTNLTPYMNYVRIDTNGNTIDSAPQFTFQTCNATTPCLVLHNGGRLMLDSPQFAGTGTSNTIQAVFDPDGIYTTSSTAQTAPKSLQFEFYYDGYMRTRGTAKNPSCHSSVCNWWPDPTYDPNWFTGF